MRYVKRDVVSQVRWRAWDEIRVSRRAWDQINVQAFDVHIGRVTLLQDEVKISVLETFGRRR